MAYDYEALTGETFQQLVQALLVKDYPDLVCYPVGMPDGGRDAASGEQRSRNALVFQVKFSREPSSIRNPFDWITNAINQEREKVERLSFRGLQEYVLVTNISASSHLDVGLMDRVQDYLEKNLPVSARCMWRGDLDRRLDGYYDLKLRYPSLLNGPDILRELWENAGSRSARDRRNRALKAYLRDQYERDATIRFKQVELVTTRLFDLFVDVPIVPAHPSERKQRQLNKYYLDASRRVMEQKLLSTEASELDLEDEPFEDFHSGYHGYFRSSRPALGAADLLLDAQFQEYTQLVVLEGAPGQGKSTLSQYLAQVQRLRLLNIEDTPNIPNNHLSSPVYLPIKIELRDFARWLRGFNPWTIETDSKHDETPTLETAISAHIQRFSGGHGFTVDDLYDVISTTPVILILDALDEVADLEDRQSVVDEIEKFTDRMLPEAVKILIFVTSRPTALSNAPALPRSKFSYCTLEAIPASLAASYARKWAKVRQLSEEDADDVLLTLRRKVRTPHMAELAKNTMQLTILLSLILSRGSSLPDKRTELYTAYLDLFLNRESEKSPDVRDNREILLDLHGYIGYYLHANAEGTRSTGRIGNDELRRLISAYLESDGRDPGMVNKIFRAVVGRVVALVSRMEGTFEFEVQPLREYFAAAYLYNTAPTSPAWKEQKGTKPDRLEGIAPNPYWMNVTRFFCGFFTKGELLDLAHRICELIRTGPNVPNVYPRRLAVALLQDWVFSQSAKATSLLVNTIFDDIGLAWAASSERDYAVPNGFGAISVRLSPGAGAEEAAKIVWSAICESPMNDRTAGLCSLLVHLVRSEEELMHMWEEQYRRSAGIARHNWALIGLKLNCVKKFPEKFIEEVLALDSADSLATERARVGATTELHLSLNEALLAKYITAILDLGIRRPDILYVEYLEPVSMFLRLSHPVLWRSQMDADGTAIMENDISLENALRSAGWDLDMTLRGRLLRAVGDLERLLRSEVSTSLAPWEEAIEIIEDLFGRNWSSIQLAVMAPAIRSNRERAAGVRKMFDDAYSLPKRIRFARRKANQPEWWLEQSGDIGSKLDAALFLAACMTWASSATILNILPRLDELLSEFSDVDLDLLLATISNTVSIRPKTDNLDLVALRDITSGRTQLLTSTIQMVLRRASNTGREKLVLDRLVHELDNPQVALDCVPIIGDRIMSGDIDPIYAVTLIRSAGRFEYKLLRPDVIRPARSLQEARRIPIDEVLNFISRVPASLIYAVMMASERRSSKPKSVLSISRDEGWFDEQ